MFRSFVRAACVLLALAVHTAPGQAQTLFRPVAVVNDSAITGFDLAQRAQILVALGFSSASPDALRAEALDQLVEDRLKIQAGSRIGVTPSADLIEAGVADMAQRSNLSADEFRVLLSSQGVTNQAVEDMVVANLVWLQVVRSRFRGRVEPGEAEIDAELNITQARGAFDFNIQEIGLPLNDDGRTEAQTRALAEQLTQQLNAGGDFAAAVDRYSRAPSATRGGNVGWVTTERMPQNLLNALGELEVGEVSAPLSVAGGLSIIRLVDRRAAAGVAQSQSQSQSQANADRETVRNRLVAQRSQRLAEGMLQELRRDALIEIR